MARGQVYRKNPLRHSDAHASVCHLLFGTQSTGVWRGTATLGDRDQVCAIQSP
jgi:hypothetical protein